MYILGSRYHPTPPPYYIQTPDITPATRIQKSLVSSPQSQTQQPALTRLFNAHLSPHHHVLRGRVTTARVVCIVVLVMLVVVVVKWGIYFVCRRCYRLEYGSAMMRRYDRKRKKTAEGEREKNHRILKIRNHVVVLRRRRGGEGRGGYVGVRVSSMDIEVGFGSD